MKTLSVCDELQEVHSAGEMEREDSFLPVLKLTDTDLYYKLVREWKMNTLMIDKEKYTSCIDSH